MLIPEIPSTIAYCGSYSCTLPVADFKKFIQNPVPLQNIVEIHVMTNIAGSDLDRLLHSHTTNYRIETIRSSTRHPI